MIIDFHTHFYPDTVAEKAVKYVATLGLIAETDGTRAGLEKSMEAAGVDVSVGMPIVNKPENSRSINEFALKNNRGKVKMFGSVHPAEPDVADTLKRISGEGLYGVKVHPEYQNFNFNDPPIYRVAEKCAELGLPLLTHAGSDIAYPPPYRSNPESLLKLHRAIPELKFICAHGGSLDMFDEVEKFLLGSGVYIDISIAIFRLSAARMAAMIRRHGADRVLFATDSPWGSQKDTLEKFRLLGLSEEENEKILHRNAETLLTR